MRYRWLGRALIAVGSICTFPAHAAWTFTTPAWTELVERYPGGIRTRADGESLLVRRVGAPIYRFDAGKPSLTPASETEWEGAGPVSDCEAQIGIEGYRMDAATGRLFANGVQLPISGFALQTLQSPSGRYGAVLTGTGKARSLLPFLGGGGGQGPYSHQIVSLPDGAVQGSATALELDSAAIRMCWGAGDRYVIYTDLHYGKMTIIRVGP